MDHALHTGVYINLHVHYIHIYLMSIGGFYTHGDGVFHGQASQIGSKVSEFWIIHEQCLRHLRTEKVCVSANKKNYHLKASSKYQTALIYSLCSAELMLCELRPVM